ncbi:hypothetical protein TanjilG_11727 [Lupinus angustifolius]|uniref:Uncharacterized protein n=1 Tax=Lupinus angustifolius TaxID=3871 RepID=A0A1J7GZK3_LUPAN|nr:hypothetical protein TanjilG_11727 [Lupinus angustifolius]
MASSQPPTATPIPNDVLLKPTGNNIDMAWEWNHMKDHHGPPKVNCWTDPLSPSKWKEEHFVTVPLSGWGLLFYGGYKLFAGGKGKEEERRVELRQPRGGKMFDLPHESFTSLCFAFA